MNFSLSAACFRSAEALQVGDVTHRTRRTSSCNALTRTSVAADLNLSTYSENEHSVQAGRYARNACFLADSLLAEELCAKNNLQMAEKNAWAKLKFISCKRDARLCQATIRLHNSENNFEQYHIKVKG